MLTKDQASVVSDALLQPGRLEPEAHATKIAIAKERRLLTQRKWLGGGALLGLAIGSAVGRWLPGHGFVPNAVGFIVVGSAGALFGRFRA